MADTDDKLTDGKVNQQSQQSTYKPAVQRHVDVNRNYLFTSIRVRVFLGEIEKDLIIKFRNQDLLAKDVCSAIENQLRIPYKYISMFRLWTFGKDIELQLDPEQKMTDLLLKWHIVMLQYTHYTEAATASHPINRYYFVYKRAAISSKKLDEEALESSVVAQLLYGEAKRNYLHGRYLIGQDDEFKLAAYQLFNRYGLCLEKKLNKLKDNPAIIKGIMPVRYKVNETTNHKIFQEYQILPKFFNAMVEFLRYMISLPCYGSCYFPVCEERPPLGYFEYRIQRWLIGVNEIGMILIDPMKKKYIQNSAWENTHWDISPIDITIIASDTQPDRIKLLSPQSPIIDNVATRAKYLWAKEVLKENMNYNIDNFKQEEDKLAAGLLPPGASAAKEFSRYDDYMVDENVEKKFTSVSQRIIKPKEKFTWEYVQRKTKEKINWKYIWDTIRSPLKIKKPGDVPYDINDGFSNIGSHQDLNLV